MKNELSQTGLRERERDAGEGGERGHIIKHKTNVPTGSRVRERGRGKK